MKDFFKKLKISDYILGIAGVFIIISFFLPKTGALVLLDEIIGLIATSLVVTYFLLAITKIIYTFKIIKITIAIIVVLAVVLFLSMNVVLDLIEGSQVITLSSVTVYNYNAGNGLVSNHYYLMGKDENDKNHRVEISSNDYYSYDKEKRTVTLEYYPHSNRVIRFKYV